MNQGAAEAAPLIGVKEENMELLEQLKAKGVATVRITFDGEGDSGGIEGIHCYDQNDERVQAGELEEALFKLGDAIIERHCEISFDNWGCFGEICLEVESGKIEIEVNTRYVSYETEHAEDRADEYLKEETA